MEKIDILEQLFDDKLLKILRLFFKDHEAEFYLREVAHKTKVPVASTFRVVMRLVELGLIEQRQIKKLKLYKLGDNENTRFLGQLVRKEKQALEVFVTRCKELKGLKTVLLHGKEEVDRANIILIVENIDQGEVKALCAAIKTEFEFTITALTLAEEQFNQMDSMGLYPGKKKVLYKC